MSLRRFLQLSHPRGNVGCCVQARPSSCQWKRYWLADSQSPLFPQMPLGCYFASIRSLLLILGTLVPSHYPAGSVLTICWSGKYYPSLGSSQCPQGDCHKKLNNFAENFLPKQFSIWVVGIPVPIGVCEPAGSICLPDKATAAKAWQPSNHKPKKQSPSSCWCLTKQAKEEA